MAIIRGVVKEINSYIKSSSTKGTIYADGALNAKTENQIIHRALIGDTNYVEFNQDIYFSVGDDVLVSGTEYKNIFKADAYHNLTKNKTVFKSALKPISCGVTFFFLSLIFIYRGLIYGKTTASLNMIAFGVMATITVGWFLYAWAVKLTNDKLRQEIKKNQA
ncbi:MAG: hypothetical protein LBF71_06120 [Campylobacteraceae bacterium]|jgi:uncharacterized membrane protein (DUF485 family)|nr:hypothetical protein [Campylobacteraceae bacterium]